MDDCESPSAYRHLERKARKYHRCCECGGVIKPGERYHVHSGIWSGAPGSYKNCADCEVIRCELDECVAFGQLSYEGNAKTMAMFNAVRAHRWAAEYAPAYWARQSRVIIKVNWAQRIYPSVRTKIRKHIVRAREADALLRKTAAVRPAKQTGDAT